MLRERRARIFVDALGSIKDRDYNTAKEDLEKITLANPSLASPFDIPPPSDNQEIEQVVGEITKHFESVKAAAFESARGILGGQFEPTDPALLSDLEKNIGRALERVSQPQTLPSAARLGALRQLSPDQLEAAETTIQKILDEANALDELEKNPLKAARSRLYARVATWIADHPDPQRDNTLPDYRSSSASFKSR